MAPQSGLPGATVEALGRFADFPQVGGLPLRAIKRPVRYEINCKSVYGDPISGLETTRIERKPLPPGLYKLPTGYRKVDDEVQLLLADEGESMEGLLDEAPPKKAAAKAVQKSTR